MNIRIQLSLFVPAHQRDLVESVRRLLDPVQASLIPAHVTLCREDELVNLTSIELAARLGATEATPLKLVFGAPEVFQGHGVLLPCVGGAAEFQRLRRWVLGNISARSHPPHITLAHPRNPKADGNTPGNLDSLSSELEITFFEVSRIQQKAGLAWQVLEQFALGGAPHSDA
ncbi:MAG: hypothetical protein IPO77_21220 [Acidobacteria bacterium]|nr:hypothetical protein [Acidobacteriota bacterium]